MRQGHYNFRNTRAKQNRNPDSQSEQYSSSMQVDIESSHTNIEEIFFNQDSSMGDRDERNIIPNQGEVMFRQLLGTLEQGQRMQQEQNRQMDMMLQLRARQMGVNINLGDANNGNDNNRGNDNNGGRGNNNGPENNINGNNGHGNNGNEADNFRHIARPTQTASSRPLLPTFPPRDPVQPVNESQITELQGQFRRDWEASGPEFQADISLRDYMDLRMRHMPRAGGRNQNFELRKKVGKLSLPYYDASGKMTARAWVQKVDTYLQLNPMPEDEAIKYAAMHLDGVAYEWWHHGMVTLGHNQITSYEEFTERLIERFDTRDPELHFKELA